MNPYLTARGALGQRSSGHAVDRKSSTKSSSERVSERVSARGVSFGQVALCGAGDMSLRNLLTCNQYLCCTAAHCHFSALFLARTFPFFEEDCLLVAPVFVCVSLCLRVCCR